MVSLISGNVSSLNPLDRILAVQNSLRQADSSFPYLAAVQSKEDTVTISKTAEALSWYQQGQSVLQIAVRMGVDVDTVAGYLGLTDQQVSANSPSSLQRLSMLPTAQENYALATAQAILENLSSANDTTSLLKTQQGYSLPLSGLSPALITPQNETPVIISEQQTYEMNTVEALLGTIHSQGNNIDAYF